ncbi:hypothetical protein LQ382_25625, partial [Rhodococcus rhodochrous]
CRRSCCEPLASTQPDTQGTRPDLPRGFRVPLVPLVPILAVLACGWLMLNLSVETWIRFAVWMVLGVAVYFVYGRRKSVLGQRLKLEAAQQEAATHEVKEPEPV